MSACSWRGPGRRAVIKVLRLEKRDLSNNPRGLALLNSVLAVVLALIFCSLLIAALGQSPVRAYAALWNGAFGNIYSITEVLVKATPLLIIGLGIIVAFKGGMFNIGADGQLNLGTIAGVMVMLYLPLGVLSIPAAILAGFAAGALWGAIPGYLKAKSGVSEVIVTIMLNFVSTLLVSYLVHGPLKDPNDFMPQTPVIPKASQFPVLIADTRLHIGFLLALALAGLVYVFLNWTPLGYKLRAVGVNKSAARYGGVNVPWVSFLAMVLSGGLAGIAGVSEVGGLHHRLLEGISPGYGFDAIAVALLGKLSPLGAIVSAILFGALRVGANAMQRDAQVPSNMVYIIQGVVVLFALGSEFFSRYRIRVLQPFKRGESNEL